MSATNVSAVQQTQNTTSSKISSTESPAEPKRTSSLSTVTVICLVFGALATGVGATLAILSRTRSPPAPAFPASPPSLPFIRSSDESNSLALVGCPNAEYGNQAACDFARFVVDGVYDVLRMPLCSTRTDVCCWSDVADSCETYQMRSVCELTGTSDEQCNAKCFASGAPRQLCHPRGVPFVATSAYTRAAELDVEISPSPPSTPAEVVLSTVSPQDGCCNATAFAAAVIQNPDVMCDASPFAPLDKCSAVSFSSDKRCCLSDPVELQSEFDVFEVCPVGYSPVLAGVRTMHCALNDGMHRYVCEPRLDTCTQSTPEENYSSDLTCTNGEPTFSLDNDLTALNTCPNVVTENNIYYSLRECNYDVDVENTYCLAPQNLGCPRTMISACGNMSIYDPACNATCHVVHEVDRHLVPTYGRRTVCKPSQCDGVPFPPSSPPPPPLSPVTGSCCDPNNLPPHNGFSCGDALYPLCTPDDTGCCLASASALPAGREMIFDYVYMANTDPIGCRRNSKESLVFTQLSGNNCSTARYEDFDYTTRSCWTTDLAGSFSCPSVESSTKVVACNSPNASGYEVCLTDPFLSNIGIETISPCPVNMRKVGTTPACVDTGMNTSRVMCERAECPSQQNNTLYETCGTHLPFLTPHLQDRCCSAAQAEYNLPDCATEQNEGRFGACLSAPFDGGNLPSANATYPISTEALCGSATLMQPLCEDPAHCLFRCKSGRQRNLRVVCIPTSLGLYVSNASASGSCPNRVNVTADPIYFLRAAC